MSYDPADEISDSEWIRETMKEFDLTESNSIGELIMALVETESEDPE